MSKEVFGDALTGRPEPKQEHHERVLHGYYLDCMVIPFEKRYHENLYVADCKITLCKWIRLHEEGEDYYIIEYRLEHSYLRKFYKNKDRALKVLEEIKK